MKNIIAYIDLKIDDLNKIDFYSNKCMESLY